MQHEELERELVDGCRVSALWAIVASVLSIACSVAELRTGALINFFGMILLGLDSIARANLYRREFGRWPWRN